MGILRNQVHTEETLYFEKGGAKGGERKTARNVQTYSILGSAS